MAKKTLTDYSAGIQKQVKALTDANDKLLEQKPGESLDKYYTRLAKAADQRLVRLEQLENSSNRYYQNITKFAYANAQDAIKRWSGEGSNRFNQKKPTDPTMLKAKIEDIKSFLSAPTSTKKGIDLMYKKQADTINKRLGTKLTWQELANYRENAKSSKADSKYGSDVVLIAIDKIKKADTAVIKDVIDTNKKHQIVKDDLVNEKINEMIKDDWQLIVDTVNPFKE